MKTKHIFRKRKNERGNVLFLILIAVALFAALSYAVTSSTRSGGGDASEETNLISSSQVTQYPSSIRTAIVRQIISDNIDPIDLEFNAPSEFTALTDIGSGGVTNYGNGVFHPDGGGAVYAFAPPEVMASNAQGTWYFNPNWEVEHIRTTDTDGDGNEITAFLPGIKRSICLKINEELGIDDSTIADITLAAATNTYEVNMTAAALSGTNFPTTDSHLGDSTTPALAGQPYGCFFNDTPDDYVYYHVLVER